MAIKHKAIHVSMDYTHVVHGFWPESDFGNKKRMPSERASQKEQNGVIFSTIPPSSDELCVQMLVSIQMYAHGKGRHCSRPKKILDGVPRTQTSRLLLSSVTTAIEATALFVQQHVKGAIIVHHVTTPSWHKMAAMPDDCERTATGALPTAASGGSISGDLGTSAALDAFSTVYELPLKRF